MPDRDVHAAPDVAAVIGIEAIDRIRRGETMAAATCRICDQAIDPADAVSLICLTVTDSPAPLRIAQLIHATCGPSELIMISDSQVNKDALENISVLTMGWPTVDGGIRMLALLHGHNPITQYDTAGNLGDGRDLAVSTYLAAGWHLASRMTQDLPPITDGTHITYRPHLRTAGAPGHWRMTGPAGELIAEVADLVIMPVWLTDVTATGAVDVYHVPCPIHTWTDGPDYQALQAAARRGEVVGARVPFRAIT